MHTETNLAQGPNGDEAVFWLWKEWANVLRVRNDGIPIVGFTSHTDTTGLRAANAAGAKAVPALASWLRR